MQRKGKDFHACRARGGSARSVRQVNAQKEVAAVEVVSREGRRRRSPGRQSRYVDTSSDAPRAPRQAT